MKRRFLLVGILILLLVSRSGSTGVAASSYAPDEDSFAGFAQELEQIRQALKIPGLSAAIVQDQTLVWAQGFGYADIENSIPATADTPYHFASVTKPFAATLLMQLVEEERLTLDDPVSRYGIQLQSPDITVWHLLTHTSDGNPGSAHDYDGNRYGLLARVISGAADESFGRLLSERFLLPLEMTHTAPNTSWAWAGAEGYLASMGIGDLYHHFPEVYQNVARPYQFDTSYNNVPSSYSLHFSPAAGLIGSVTDIAKFDIALDNDELIQPATKAEMFSPAIANSGKPLIYGLGWYTQNYNDTRIIWHSGGWSPSVSALYLKVPDENLTFIALANNYNLTRPYPLDSGDVLYSTPALAFYKHFVFPRLTGKRVPTIDWTADEAALTTQLKAVTDTDVRAVLERELWSYRKLYASVGTFDKTDMLVRVHRRVFTGYSVSRVTPASIGTNGPVAEPQPVSLLPYQVVTISRVLLGWIVLTIVALIYLLVDFSRQNTWRRPYKLAWLLITALFGILGIIAYLASGGRQADRYPTLPPWRRALGPALFSVTGNMVGLTLGLVVVYVWFPDTPGAPPAILGMLLTGWLLFRTPLAAWVTTRRYWSLLPRTFLLELGSTFFVLLGSLPTMIFLMNVIQDPVPDDPLFLVVLVPAALAGTLVVYLYAIWLVSRRRSWVNENTAAYVADKISRRYST